MSFLSAKSFVYNKKSSEDFNLLIAWTDDINVSENGLHIDLKKTPNKSKLNTNIYGVERNENIIFDFTIFHKDFSEIQRIQSIQINEWLTSSSTPKLLMFNDNDSYPLHYYAICTNIDDIVIGGKLIGKHINFETNSSFSFSEKNLKTCVVNGSNQLSINNTTNSYEIIIYPKIIIETTSASPIIIENITEKKSVTIKTDNITPMGNGNKFILLDSLNMSILDKENRLIPAYKIGWENNYKSYVSCIDRYINNIYWVRIIKGMNKLKVTGNCKIMIEYEIPRKAGCL